MIGSLVLFPNSYNLRSMRLSVYRFTSHSPSQAGNQDDSHCHGDKCRSCRGRAQQNSLARPGGNVTGLTLLTRDLSGKKAGTARRVGSGNIAGRNPLGCPICNRGYWFQKLRGYRAPFKDPTSIH